MDTYGAVSQDMKEVEQRLISLENVWAVAVTELVVLQAKHDLREAQLTLTFKGMGTIPEVQARVVEALWSEPDDLMERLVGAEAKVEACKATYKTLDRALSGMQSRLSAITKVDLFDPNPN